MMQTLTEQQQTARIEPLSARYLSAAASLLFQSYHDDPLFMEIFKADKPDYDKRFRAAIAEEVNVFWQSGESVVGLFVGEQLMGVSCVVSPNFGHSVGRFWHWRLKMLLTAGFVSTKQLVEKEEKIRTAIPYDRYHMMAFIAIHPNHQKNGLGNMLIEAVDDLVESDPSSSGMGIYVTFDKYMDFFKTYGYEFISKVSVGYVKGSLLFRRSPLLDAAER